MGFDPAWYHVYREHFEGRETPSLRFKLDRV
jgi:hypothetical protein